MAVRLRSGPQAERMRHLSEINLIALHKPSDNINGIAFHEPFLNVRPCLDELVRRPSAGFHFIPIRLEELIDRIIFTAEFGDFLRLFGKGCLQFFLTARHEFLSLARQPIEGLLILR